MRRQNDEEQFSHIEGIGIFGLRFGATIASIAAERIAETRFLVLWEPLMSGSRYMQDLLRSNIATQAAVYKEVRKNRNELIRMMEEGHTVNVDGYELSRDFFREASELDLLAQEKGFEGECLVVQLDRKKRSPRNETVKLAGLYRRSQVRCEAEEPFWKEIKTFYSRADNACAATMEWLEERDGRS